jgi:4-amino-4-deoxy-L-arabinose transferase-like glycosyltransferase
MAERRGDLLGVWAVALAAAAFRVALVWGLDLYADEAYYWTWSLRPAAGYFDHPPMVAWLIRLSSAVLPGEAGVRILFVACGALAVVFAALVARELSGDPRAPLAGALLAATAPLLTLTGALALPDAPVEAAYAAATWLLARARGRRWLWAGVAVGLALLSKHTAALLAPALLLLVAWDRELRRELATPWPWAGAAVAIAIFLPNLWWNATHEWVTIAFQLRHGFGGTPTVRSVLEYVGGQLGGPGPVVLPLAAWFLLRQARAAGAASAARRVAAATLFPFAVTTLSALRGPVEANWAAFAYPGLAGAAGAALAAMRPRLSRALLGASVGLGLAAAAAFAFEARHPVLAPVDSPLVARFRGWKEFAARARDAVDRACASVGSPAGCDGADPFVFTDGYQEAAALAYYAGWRRFGRALARPSQLDLWAEAPPPGSPFVTLAVGPVPDTRGWFRAEGPGLTRYFEVRLKGDVMHRAEVTPYERYLGPVPRGGRDLH